MINFRSLPIAVMLSTLDPASKRDRAIAVISAATLFGIALTYSHYRSHGFRFVMLLYWVSFTDIPLSDSTVTTGSIV